MPTATLTSKGQVNLPKTVREALRVRAGDRVDFVVDANGEVHVRRGRFDVRDLRGILRRRGKRVTGPIRRGGEER